MSNSLSALHQQILNEYNPLNNLDQQLFASEQRDAFYQFVEARTETLNPSERKRVVDELFGWGPLEDLKNDTEVFDIIVQGYDNIYIDGHQGIRKHSDGFFSKLSFNNFIERLCGEANFVVDHNTPFADAKIANFRIHLAIPPLAKQTSLTLRRHRESLVPLQELNQTGFLSNNQLEWVTQQLNNNKNILVVGPTGSGKTTFLNSLLNEIPDKQRLVIIEDTDELLVPNRISTKLLSRENQSGTLSSVSLSDLVKQSLRMRPDRLVIGEVRGGEAKDLLQALATGHSGSMATLHASSAQQALIRLEMLIQQGAPQWNLHSIRQLIKMSLDYIIVLKEDRQQKGIAEICGIGSLESIGLLLENLDL